jgi:DNA mismatch endonuclease Vsr
MMINCKYCGDKIVNNNIKYCSRQCKVEAQKKQVEHKCIICGKLYTTFEKYNNGNGSKFCSQKCRSNQKFEKVCLYCGKTFLIKPSAYYGFDFCSIKCKVSNGDKYRKRICKNCNKEFYVSYPSVKKSFCSKECKSDYAKITTICALCGKEFKHRPSIKRKYCSTKCSNNVKEKVDKFIKQTIDRIENGECVSKVELLLKPGLIKLGFTPQYISEYGSIDYAYINKKIAVFVDGVFWHGRDDYDHWKNTSFVDKINKTKKRDKWQNNKFKEDGWLVFRFWEDQINSNIDECLNVVKEATNNR